MRAFAMRHTSSRFADTYTIVRDAILGRRQVIAIYRGLRREMCPHVLGVKHGRTQCLFYQFGGESRSGLGPDGSPENWRCIPIIELEDVEVRDGPWHTAPGYGGRQGCVDYVDVAVAPAARPA